MPDDALYRIYSMTKPIVTVAAMTLVEDGRLLISDPLAKYIPAFADAKVGVEKGDRLELAPLKRPITIQDLMRHTSGLTYGFTGASPVQKLVLAAAPMSQEKSAAEHVEALAALPLQHQPGEVWEYSHSTDVLGRVIEIVAGARLGEFLSERIFAPLGMADTAFYASEAKRARLAEPFSLDMLTAAKIDTIDAREPPRCEMGGGGLLSTMGDYAHFLAMLSGGGAVNGARILGSRTLAFMASDHLGPRVVKNHPLLWPGHGFGLGFAVRTEPGVAPTAGAVGEYFWGGVAGTAFWVSPRDALFAILMVQAPEHRDRFRMLFRNLVNAAIV
jgi:CubicO group peptidase (beta-lactamase class C family)